LDEFPSRERTTSVALEPRVSAVIVVRNVRAKLPGQAPLDLCLRSVLAEPVIDDLVIVDQKNGPDVSATLRALQADRRDVKVISASPNASYAAAANLGAREALGRWLLFLDPGVVLQRGAIARMAAAGDESPKPCIVGGRLTDLEGRERLAARAGALTAFSAIAVAMDLPAPKPKRAAGEAARVAAVSGAFMAIPRRDFEALHGFDEEFKTDCADLDLCRRANAAGGAILFHPAAAGVQFARPPESGRKQAQGLARFVARSAKTGPERAFAAIAEPALAVLLALKDLVVGRPPIRR
jgi:N-acetylglucosaminyl-diphospho-decaprenol L-rhamnosyltransferase